MSIGMEVTKVRSIQLFYLVANETKNAKLLKKTGGRILITTGTNGRSVD